MSVSQSVTRACPACDAPNELLAYDSINADRHAALRSKVLDGSLQRVRCAGCGSRVREQPECSYIDLEHGLWAQVMPFGEVGAWAEHEEELEVVHDESFGALAPAAAQEIGRGLTPRLVFGWAALKEKLLCAMHGLDDVSVELAKLAMLRSVEDAPLSDDSVWRLVDVTPQELHFAVMAGPEEAVSDTLTAPRALLAEIEAEPEAWAALRDELSGVGFFVDLERTLVASEVPG